MERRLDRIERRLDLSDAPPGREADPGPWGSALPAAQHLSIILRRSSVELVRSLLPPAKGVRLLGVIVSNFDPVPADADEALPLFGAGGAAAQENDTAPRVSATGIS
jgi:hypothetical protein